MPPATTARRSRSYYYVTGEGNLGWHVVPYRKYRRHQIPATIDPKSLMIVIERDGNQTRVIERGPMYNEQLEHLAMLQEFGVELSNRPDVGTEIPNHVLTGLIGLIGARIDDAARRIVANWDNLGGESDMVALLVDSLHCAEQIDDWSISIRPQVFSDQVKEPHVGADLAWVVQISIGTVNPQRTTKALWMQAKKYIYDIKGPGDIFVLKDFAQQFAAMKRRTTEAFGLVFTLDGIVVGNETQILSPEALFREAILCVRGDQRAQVIAASLDRHYLMIADIHRKRRRPLQRSRAPGRSER